MGIKVEVAVEAPMTDKNKRVCICLGGGIDGDYHPCKEKQNMMFGRRNKWGLSFLQR